MSVSDTYKHVLKSYEENPKVQILRKIRGKQVAQSFAPFQLDEDIQEVKGFLYIRHLRKTARLGLKLVVQTTANAEPSVIGHEEPL
jgi:hypothetical protein